MAKSYAYVGAPSFIGAVEGRLADAGFSRVSDVASADIVVTFATSGSALEDLYFGDEGLVTTAAPGSTLVDLSAATPNFAREINAVATVNDLVMVEAPATVRSLVAADAFARENLLGPVATEAELTDEVRWLLDAIFGEVVEVGAPGRAQLLRNTHTLPLAADLVSAIEAVALDDASARSVGRWTPTRFRCSAPSPPIPWCRPCASSATPATTRSRCFWPSCLRRSWPPTTPR